MKVTPGIIRLRQSLMSNLEWLKLDLQQLGTAVQWRFPQGKRCGVAAVGSPRHMKTQAAGHI